METRDGYALGKVAPASNTFANWQTYLCLSAYLMLWVGSVVVIHNKAGLALSEPLLIFAVVGIGFSTLAWFLTRRSEPLPYGIKRPKAECSVLAGYLVLVVLFLTWGIDALKAAVQHEPWQMSAMLGAKLVLFVLLPLALFCALWQYQIRELITAFPILNHLRVAVWMSLVLIVFQVAFGRGVSEIRHSGLPLWAVAAGIHDNSIELSSVQ
jgi:hypothetical protein